MAIGTDAAIDFFGTADTVTSSSSAVTDTSFSVAADVSTWTNDDDANFAAMVLQVTFSVAPTSGGSISLYGSLQNVEGTDDQLDPSSAFAHVPLGVFPVKDVTTLQSISISIPLPNVKTSQEYLFFVENRAGQTMSAAWDLIITPKAVGPSA